MRFSGRAAEPPPGADVIGRYSADAEYICAGFWPGDARHPESAFFSYASPRPEGIEEAAIEPGAAGWSAELGEFLLPYDAVRAAPDPRQACSTSWRRPTSLPPASGVGILRSQRSSTLHRSFAPPAPAFEARRGRLQTRECLVSEMPMQRFGAQ